MAKQTQNITILYKKDKEGIQYIDRWLTGRNPRTTAIYKAALKAYLEYTKLTPQELIKEASDDLLRPITEIATFSRGKRVR